MFSDRPTLFTSNSQTSNDLSLLQIIKLITDTFGIHIHPQYQDNLQKAILTQIKALGLSSFSDYYNHLIGKKQLLSGLAESQELISLLSVTESYFFRDRGQFWLLKNQILPELIERKRQLYLTQAGNGQKPVLRFWSAGCSTGEEAYSLAILVKELIPDYQAWDILILGIDINQSAIALAQQGIYSDWSFRTTDLEVKNRYFHSHKKGWKIDPSIQKMVTFQLGNLVQDSYPNYLSRIHDLDLIICRNVFIYFDFSAISLVVDKFYHSLASGGFLIAGHTELHGQKTELFQIKNFPQSVVYQRSSPLIENVKLADPHPNRPNAQFLSLKDWQADRINSLSCGVKATEQTLSEERSLTQGTDADTIKTAKQLIPLTHQDFQTFFFSAEAYANLGQYAHAIQACQQALQIDPLAIEPYYLLAQIAEEQGDIEGAKLFLKRIIYIEPNSVSAYIELGSIYMREGNRKQAQKTWRSLLEILQGLPQEQVIDSSNPQTIAELKSHILKHLETEPK
jgi:chemotaxis protein methyltransferase CheR